MVKRLKPVTPSSRHRIISDRSSTYKGRPYKSLTQPRIQKSGRNSLGRISVRHRGGGHKHHYRVIDFLRNKTAVNALVERIEYDPNRSAYIALVIYKDGERRYIIAPEGLKVGDSVTSAATENYVVGTCLPLSDIPSGSEICCVELRPGGGAKIARSAGTFCQLLAKDGDTAVVRLRSSEVRRLPLDCRATIGRISNSEHALCSLGKAGAKRWRGVRPTVRGVAMNPIDHPHGGGEGRTSGGRHPVSPWGMPTKGYKTRSRKKSTKHIVSQRKR